MNNSGDRDSSKGGLSRGRGGTNRQYVPVGGPNNVERTTSDQGETSKNFDISVSTLMTEVMGRVIEPPRV